MDGEGHPGVLRVIRRSHREAIDIERPAAEEACNPCQNTGLVLHYYGDGVPHAQSSELKISFRESAYIFSRWLIWDSSHHSSSRISLMVAPAGTMGETFSAGLTMKSMTVGRSDARAALITGSTSDGFVARRPTAP